MKTRGRWMQMGLTMILGAWATGLLADTVPQPADAVRLVWKEGTVEIIQAGAALAKWTAVETNNDLFANYRLRTREHSRVTLQMPDGGVQQYGANTEIEILSVKPGGRSGLRLLKGIFSFFHKDEPRRLEVLTRGSYASSDGTEFVMEVKEVNGVERVTLYVIDGQVTVTNAFGLLPVTNGQSAIVEEGQKPVRSAGFITNNILQWAFYYPAVLHLRDLPLGAAERLALTNSLTSYLKGDLLAALANYPAGRLPASDAERVYRAALLLSVGNVPQAEAALAALPAGEPTATLPRLAGALRQLIAAVKRQPRPTLPEPVLASEFLAASYYEQSRAVRESSLRAALALARRAATNSPEFSFAWARVAELEFGFGRTGAANEALDRSLASAERNAEALALRGFVAAARNRTREARELFDRAIAVDPALANAWLGRGLVSIRRGDDAAGRADLLVAAALEPQRSLLRSYLGKALANSGDFPRAIHELDLAKQRDPADPTPWLYSALLNEQANRINEGILDLAHSVALNDNRFLFRSQELLDQDRAVRQANLARLYNDAGMTVWSVLEAGRAVASDYANHSAHLFLAGSYDKLRDPYRINLRYETPAESEYLIANLLAPTGAGLLSSTISQQEYSRLLERDRIGVASSTEYLSRGAWTEHGAVSGSSGNSSFLFEGLYRNDSGERPNADFEETELRLHLKQQITPQDSVYLRLIHYQAEGGDTRQLPDPRYASLGLRTSESQDPIIHVGYDHTWAPGVHTLLLAGRISDRYSVDNTLEPTLFIIRPPGRNPTYFEQFWTDLDYRSIQETYTAELQQIIQRGDHTTVFGAIYQKGEFEAQSLQHYAASDGDITGFFDPTTYAARQHRHWDFERMGGYFYHDWRIWPEFRLVGGLDYEYLRFPDNFRSPPANARQDDTDRLLPKAGFVWTPGTNTTARFAYSRALTGASIDQSFLLEPSSVAGINQSYRSITPESLGGSGVGARLDIYGLSLDHKTDHDLYLSLSGQLLDSSETRRLGAFRYNRATFFAFPSDTREQLDYTEKTLLLTANQLVGRDWAFGATYRLTHADLDEAFPEVSPAAFAVNTAASSHLASTLHQVTLRALHARPCGFFAEGNAIWSAQDGSGDFGGVAPEDFWQFNLYAGWRWAHRHAELRVGLLNLTDQDYHLHPVNLYAELPHSRTVSVRFQFNF